MRTEFFLNVDFWLTSVTQMNIILLDILHGYSSGSDKSQSLFYKRFK